MNHPRHLVAAGLLICSHRDRLLMVQTFNRLGEGLILPGGLVEEGESPATAASREVFEELGLIVDVDRLLAVEHRSARHGHPSSLEFVFMTQVVLDEDTAMTKQPDEIAEIHWIERSAAVQRHGQAGQARMAAALEAMTSRRPTYLET